MARNRRANAVVFGFDFQVNAAIVIMLENIENLQSLRLEGNFEDIEIECKIIINIFWRRQKHWKKVVRISKM